MTFDLNKEYDALIEKHKGFFDRMCEDGFCVYGELCGPCSMKATLADAFFNELPTNAKIAVCGTGYYTWTLIHSLSQFNYKRILYFTCADKVQESARFLNHKIMSPQELREKDVDLIILSTREYRAEMRSNLLEAGFTNEQLLDIYYPLEELSNPAVQSQTEEEHGCGYNCITPARINPIALASLYEYYENSKYILCERNQIEALYSAITGFIAARDIINTKRIARQYIESKYPMYESLEVYIGDLDKLMQQAREHIQARKDEAVIIYLLDAFEYINLSFMPNLRKLYQKSLVFDKAFTQYCSTTATLQVMFTGKDLIDEKAFEVTTFTEDNSPLLQTIKANGYKLHVIRSDHRTVMFPENATVDFHDTPKIASCTYFQMLAVLSGKDEKQIIFTHTFEPHIPYYSPYNYQYREFGARPWPLQHDSLSVFVPLARTLTYLDEQYNYHDSYLPATATRIVMSDHGNDYIHDKKYSASDGLYEYVNQFYYYTRITLFINAPHIKAGIIKDLFCIKDFLKLLCFIWGQCEISSVLNSYVKYQSLPYYSEAHIKTCAPHLPLPTRGIIDSDGFYMMQYDGKETYRTNDNINRMDDPDYREAVDKMRTLCGDWAYDIFEHPKMIHAKKAYREMGLI